MDLNPLPTFVTADASISITEPGVYVCATTGSAPTITMPPRVQPYLTAARISPLVNVYRIVLKAGAKPATVTREPSGGDTFSFGGSNVSSFQLMPGEAVTIIDDGGVWVPTFEFTTTRYARVSASSAASLTLSRAASLWECTCTGNSTYTLPALADNKGIEYTIKNTGPATCTVQRAGTDQLHDGGAAVNSVTIAAGASRRIVGGSVYWITV